MNKQKKIYLIGIGGIGVSAIARYYLSEWWAVSWSDSTNSAIIEALKSQWCDIIIWSDATRLTSDFDLVVYTEAIPHDQEEFQRSQELGIKIQKYNVALSKIANHRKLIAVTGTHGKSTTSSLISIILKNSEVDFLSVVGTLLKEFWWKNFFRRTPENPSPSLPSKEEGQTIQSYGEYFVIEACEHKEHFLEYTPSVLVITNIEYDHADYFKTPELYIKAFEKMISKVVPGGFVILSTDDPNTQKLLWIRKDINYIEVSDNVFSIGDQSQAFPNIQMKVPGEHVLFDAKLAYIVGHMVGISNDAILSTLSNYRGVWRRMEIIWDTKNDNILMSDYGHHPTEIQVTLDALRKWYPDKKIFTVFQPHQYSRTIELLDDFIRSFSDTDTLIIPDIYESRDSEENKWRMSPQMLVDCTKVFHRNVVNGEWMKNTLKLIEEYDSENPDSSIILLLGAGNVDNLRYKLEVI